MIERIPINLPSITELEIRYVNDAVATGWGTECYAYINRLEKTFARYLSVNYAHLTSSCTGAIHLALLALGVKPGDEVIIPDITWIASVEPVLYIGAKPVFVDVKQDTWCIDPEKLELAITHKTKAIIVVHIYGNLVEMDEVMTIAQNYNLKVLEDAAEGLGSEYKGSKAGSIAHVGVFSFHGTKTMTTGEGGILVTNELSILEKVKILNNHGRNPKIKKKYWMNQYGYKYKISNIQAALGCAQLERIDELVEKKRQVFKWYQVALRDCPSQLNFEQDYAKNSYWLPTVVFDKNVIFDRELFFSFMMSHNIDSRPFFYPLSSLPMFLDKPENKVAYAISYQGINLPSYHDITIEIVNDICEKLIEFINV